MVSDGECRNIIVEYYYFFQLFSRGFQLSTRSTLFDLVMRSTRRVHQRRTLKLDSHRVQRTTIPPFRQILFDNKMNKQQPAVNNKNSKSISKYINYRHHYCKNSH